MRNLLPLFNTLIFTLVVPGTVAALIPNYLRRGPVLATGPAEAALAILVIAVGAAIYVSTALWGFAAVGGGTPAPIAPTKILVTRGLHRYVRNPMYLGVLCIVLGQAWLAHSWRIAIYAAIIWLIAHLFVLTYEEPTLRRRFGAEYELYCAAVPRWIPTLRH
jgi:protein-S-isoprenylcysteine O-methyltransferase Ste14